MKIDREHLLSLTPRPCADGLAAFVAAFPHGLTVEGEPDEATLTKLAKLDLGWFASTLPTEALVAYDRAEAEAGAAYDRATAEAWAAYRRAEAEAGAAYDRAEAEAGAAYRRAEALAMWRIVADMGAPS